MIGKSYKKKLMNQQSMIKDIHQWLKTAGVKQEGTMEQFQLVKRLILEELAELEEAVINGDRDGQRDAIVDLFVVTTNWDYMNNLNSEDFIKPVSDSNWSKFCTSEEEAQKTVDAYKSGTHWTKPGQIIDCHYVYENDYWIVKRPDGKLLKSIKYKDPV